MKKRVFLILSMVHLILWIAFLLISVLAKFTYRAQNLDPLDFALSKGVYNVFVIVAVAGIINATVLFLSLRALSNLNPKCKGKRIAALCFSTIATILFYSFAVLLFFINTDKVVIIPIIWLLCELYCCLLLVLSGNNKSPN